LELRVRLSTLLGLDQYPAELAGWGFVHAELARALATTLGGAQWRFAATDEDGQLTHCGMTRARPLGTLTRSAACRAIVELQVTSTALRDLAADPTTLGDWAGVVADLAHQLAHDIPGEGRYDADADRRAPSAALRRYLEIRDRYCTMIGCRAPAHTADKDHTHDHAKGGATIGPNLGEARWRIRVPATTDPNPSIGPGLLIDERPLVTVSRRDNARCDANVLTDDSRAYRSSQPDVLLHLLRARSIGRDVTTAAADLLGRPLAAQERATLDAVTSGLNRLLDPSS
jgi:hypothetical protein